MPLYSDPGYYYGSGGYQVYSPYYVSPTSYSYSPYGRSSLSSPYITPSSRVNISSSRYKPKLSTISETPVSVIHTGLIPLTRIQSPKISYHTSPTYKAPRPIPINTADIDVSAKRFRKREESKTNEIEAKSEEAKTEQKADCNNNDLQKDSEQTDDETGLSRHCSTIKRDRAVVRLSTIRLRGKEANGKESSTTTVPNVKKSRFFEKDTKDQDKIEKVSWRDMLGEDLLPKNRVKEKKSPGELLLERYLIRDDSQKEDNEPKSFIDLSKIVIEDKNKEEMVEIDPFLQSEIRRLSLPKLPSFHEICEDISSDKLDDDLNAGELRRKASLIQEQEIELFNQLQKSGSGTFELFIERSESQDDCRRSKTKRSKGGKKIRHKITATVHVDNPPLSPITPEPVEEYISSEPKLKAKVENIEEDHMVHHVVKLPKKKHKLTKNDDNSDVSKLERIDEVKTPRSSIEKKDENICEDKMNSLQDVKHNEYVAKIEDKKPEEKNIEELKEHDKVAPKSKVALKLKKEEDIQSPTKIKILAKEELPLSPKLMTVAKEVSIPSPSKVPKGNLLQSPKPKDQLKKNTSPEYFTFDTSPSETSEVSPKDERHIQSPELKSPKEKTTDEKPKVAKPKPIQKFKKSDSGEDFWAQIGSRETQYMTNRRKQLLDQQWKKREEFLENQEISELNNIENLKEIKTKLDTQKIEDLIKADQVPGEGNDVKRSKSDDSVIKKEQDGAGTVPNKTDALKTEPELNAEQSGTKTEKVASKNQITETKDQTKGGDLKVKQENVAEEKIPDNKVSNEKGLKTILPKKVDTNKSNEKSQSEQKDSTEKKLDDVEKQKIEKELNVVTKKTEEIGKDKNVKISKINENEKDTLPKVKTKTPPPKNEAQSNKIENKITESQDGKDGKVAENDLQQQKKTGEVKIKLTKPAKDKMQDIEQSSTTPTTSKISNTDKRIPQRSAPKISTGPEAKSPETKSKQQNNRDIVDSQASVAENDVYTPTDRVSSSLLNEKEKSPDVSKKEDKALELNASKDQSLTPTKDDAKYAKLGVQKEDEDALEKKKSQINQSQSDDNKTRANRTGSLEVEEQQKSGSTGRPEGLSGQQKVEAIPTIANTPTPINNSADDSQINLEKVNESGKTSNVSKLNIDTVESTIGTDNSDVGKSSDQSKDKLPSCKAIGNLSKFPTVSNLATCLRDVDRELSDYNYSSEEDSSYASSRDDSSNMKKKNRQHKKKDEAKFDPNKAVKLDHKKKCYVKEEAPPYPLVATPRPLWKREKFNYANNSESDSDETESESEISSSDDYSDEINQNKDGIIRMSTCSSDSGFDGGTAPSSPKKMLGKDIQKILFLI